MKKTKLIAIALTLVFTMLVPIVVSAASPVDGYVAVQGLPAGVEAVEATSPAAAQETLRSAALSAKVAGGAVMFRSISLVDANGNPCQPGTAVTVRVDIAGVTTKDTVTVVHLMADGSTEVINANTYDGYVTFSVNSFSDFAFFLDKADDPGNTTPVSPKTGIYY